MNNIGVTLDEEDREAYKLGIKHGAIEELEKIAKEMKSCNRYSFEDLKIIDKHTTEIKLDISEVKIIE